MSFSMPRYETSGLAKNDASANAEQTAGDMAAGRLFDSK
jgi:hypothetical protein